MLLVVGLFCLADAAKPAYGWVGDDLPAEGLTLVELDIEASIPLYPMHGDGWKLRYHSVVECDDLPAAHAHSSAFVYLSDDTLWVRPRAGNAYQQVMFESRLATCGEMPPAEMKVVVGRGHQDLILYRVEAEDFDREKSKNWAKVSFIQGLFEAILCRLKHEREERMASMSVPRGWCMGSVNMTGEIIPTEFACVESMPDFNDMSPTLVCLRTDCTFWVKNVVENRYEQLAIDRRSVADGSEVLVVAAGDYQGAVVCDCDTPPTADQKDFVEQHFEAEAARLREGTRRGAGAGSA